MTALYRYRARDAQGALVQGSMESTDADTVLASLRSRALCVTQVRREHALVRAAAGRLRVGAPKRKALLGFFRAFATMIGAGISLRRALGVTLERTGDRRLREAVAAVLAEVDQGATLSASMGARPRCFDTVAVAMIAAGERGGILDDVLAHVALLRERDDELRKKVAAALAYPAVVFTAAAALIVFLLARIVPMFAEMFAAFHAPLPGATRALLGLGTALTQPWLWYILLTAAAAAIAGYAATRRSPRGRRALDVLRLGAPCVGPLLRKATTARVVRMLSALLRSGVELVAAIAIVAPVADSPVYAEALAGVGVALHAGEPLTVSFAGCGIFDALSLALLRAGEESGSLDTMLATVAAHLETDVDAAIAALAAVIEPALLVGLGSVVGFIVFSIFIPLYSLIGSVSK